MALSCKKIKEKIFKDYPWIKFERSTFGSQERDGVVYLADDDYDPKTMVDLFNILHEIGHAFTSEPEDSRAEREWMATMWAIFHMKRYGIKIPEWRKENFQDDIYKWYNLEKELGRSHRMSKSALKLRWRE